MKITSIRVSKLVSGPGFNNHSVAAEGEVEPGEGAYEAYEKLVAWVDDQLRIHKETGTLREQYEHLQREVHGLEKTRDSLAKQVKELGKKLPDEMPF